MERCKQITDEFKSRALGSIYSFPIDPVRDQLFDYDKIVKKPMDFETISKKLNNKVYRSTNEWYNDMYLVFQNAIDYYSPTSEIYLISQYYLKEFKKISIGLNITSESEWIKNVSEATQRLTKCFSHPPSLQNYSQKVIDIKNKLDFIHVPDDKEMSVYLDKLNSLGAKEETKADLYEIFKEIGFMPPENIKTPIDITKLPPNVKKSLIQYAKEQ